MRTLAVVLIFSFLLAGCGGKPWRDACITGIVAVKRELLRPSTATFGVCQEKNSKLQSDGSYLVGGDGIATSPLNVEIRFKYSVIVNSDLESWKAGSVIITPQE